MKFNITDSSHPKIKSPWGTYHSSLSLCITHLVHPGPWAKTVPGMGLPLLQKCVLWSWSIREHRAAPILRKVGTIPPCSWHLAHQSRQLNPEPFWQYQLCKHVASPDVPIGIAVRVLWPGTHQRPRTLHLSAQSLLITFDPSKPIYDHSWHKDVGHYEMGHCDGDCGCVVMTSLV